MLLQESHLNWTIVRPVGLTNSKSASKIKVSTNTIPKPNLTINRRSVAKYMVDSLQQPELFGKTMVISNE